MHGSTSQKSDGDECKAGPHFLENAVPNRFSPCFGVVVFFLPRSPYLSQCEVRTAGLRRKAGARSPGVRN